MEQDKVQGQQLMNINKLYGSEDAHECSYCKVGKTMTWSFTKQVMLPHTYQLMMERGWRRCGTYYYKNNIAQNCCKQWTIRQDATKYRMKKDQKKTVKKMMSLAYDCQQVMVDKPLDIQALKESKLKKSTGKIILSVGKQFQVLMLEACKLISQGIKQHLLWRIPHKDKFNFDVLPRLKFFTADPTAKGDYYCNYVMLLFGINKKYFDKQYSITKFVSDTKQTIEKLGSTEEYKVVVEKNGYLIFTLNEQKKKEKSHQFQIIQIEEQQLKNKQQKVPEPTKEKYKPQKIGTHKQHSKILLQKKKESQCQIIKPVFIGEMIVTTDCIRFGKLRVDLVPVQQSNESWKLYQNYCESIHDKKEKKMSSYISFLCTDGLSSQTVNGKDCEQMYIPSWDPNEEYQKGKPIGKGVRKRLGCFHMKYYLQEKLIGVGVVDIVPSGLSSVYYFYDPQYKDYRLGVFSSIIEIEYVRFLSKVFPQFKYYYMGFYLQNNEKMSYKSDYQPCQILCPQTYTFVQFTPQLKEHIDKIISKQIQNTRLAPPHIPVIPDMKFTEDIGVYIDKHLKLKYKNEKLTLSQINPKFYVPVLKILKSYIQVWGKQLFDILTFTF